MSLRVRSGWLLLFIPALALLVSGERAGTATDNIGNYQGFGDAGGFLNVIPPGQDGVLNGPEALGARVAGVYPPHIKDQLAMYGDLVYNTPGLAEERLHEFFKDASFGVREDDIDRVYSPTEGVVVIRDKSFGVPHIFGQTRYATMYAQGYAAAEDRLFLMDVLRHVGRARLSEFLGASPSNQALDRDQLAVAPYKEEDYTAQLLRAQSGPEGATMQVDLLGYIDGVNAYIQEALLDPAKMPAEYPALQQVPLPFKAEDVVAIASLVGGIFGRGGGGELTNFCGLKAMSAELGPSIPQDERSATARRIFDDLHFADDPEAPVTSSRPASYMNDLGPVDPAAHPDLDCASLEPIDNSIPSLADPQGVTSKAAGRTYVVDTPWGSFPLDLSTGMSNALLIGRRQTANGRPIAVFGPQTGYFIPQLLVEKDVHGPGIDARGVAFAGTDLYVQLGRGTNYAWSATSAGADNVDQFILRLCEADGSPPTTDSMGYLRNGVCEPIDTYQHTQVAKPSAGGIPEGPDIVLSWRVERTEHYGPLVARGTLTDGTPVAVAGLRSTYRNELGSAPAFFHVNNSADMAGGFDSFRQIMGNGVHYTFNWFYVDAEDIGYQHSCKCPQRAQGVDPYLPAWGTGQYDWQGFISFDQQPWDLNPAQGYITSWNNKQAHGWKANDRQFSYGPVYRSQMLDRRIEAAFAQGTLDRADAVDIMEDAGTVDLRGQEVLGYVLQVMGDTAPPGSDTRAQEMRGRIAAWVAADAHRRDHDRSGEYDDPQSPAIIDAWWPIMGHAIFDAGSAHAIDNLRMEIDDSNRVAHLGSAFQGGLYSHVQKDLRQALGAAVTGPFSKTYCGGSDLSACRAALWQSLSDAAAALEDEFDSPNVPDWKRAMADEDVRHTAVGVTEVPAIHWINRPTFQQVVQVGLPVPAGEAFGAGALPADSDKKISFLFRAEAFVGGAGTGLFRLHDHATGARIDMTITAARPGVSSGCGSIPAGAAHAFEFSGTAKFNGGGQHAMRVCAQDNGDPGAGLDRLHAECASCPYNTSTASTSEVLSKGNIRVDTPANPTATSAGEASVIFLETASGSSGGLLATVLDANGDPAAGVTVTLVGPLATPLAVLTTNGDGQALFLPGVGGVLSVTAGGVDSNPVLLN